MVPRVVTGKAVVGTTDYGPVFRTYVHESAQVSYFPQLDQVVVSFPKEKFGKHFEDQLKSDAKNVAVVFSTAELKTVFEGLKRASLAWIDKQQEQVKAVADALPKAVDPDDVNLPPVASHELPDENI